MNWKVKGIEESGHIGCLCCGGSSLTLGLDTVLYQGFGGWVITRNGELFHCDDCNKEWDEYLKLDHFEKIAEQDPDNDWRASVDLPLMDAVYQRHEKDKWVLIMKGEGFA